MPWNRTEYSGRRDKTGESWCEVPVPLCYSGNLFPFLLFRSPPGIINTDWMVVYTEDKVLGKVYQELNFFVQLRDDDGEADISELYLIRDDLSWSWKIDSSNWVTYSQDGEFWLGANGLTPGTTSSFLPENTGFSSSTGAARGMSRSFPSGSPKRIWPL